jgi:SAM-dependent methyltransferase
MSSAAGDVMVSATTPTWRFDMTTETTQTITEAKVEAFAGRLIEDVGAAMNSLLVHIGDRLGLWSALAALGPTTPTSLAEETSTNPRMVREWLSAQTASGYLTYDPDTGTFTLPPEHAFVLADENSPAAMAGGFQVLAAIGAEIDRAVEAVRTGKGLGWADHHPGLFEGVERFFRPAYRTQLTTTWIPALDGIADRLAAGGRVADVGCGHGASAIVVAEAYPQATVLAFDAHEPSIEIARERAADAGVGGRVTFGVAKARELPGDGFDLVMFCDCLHDMDDPLGAARRAAQVLAPGGSVMLVEPFANDRLEDNLNPVGRMYYAGSTLICTPCSLADDGPGLGAQAGEARLRAILQEAGFTTLRRAAETPFNIVYEARLDAQRAGGETRD